MGKDNKKYWLDKSTLAGVVKTGEEIPKGLIKDERMAEFEKDGLVGELPKSTIDLKGDTKKVVEALKKENAELKAELEKINSDGEIFVEKFNELEKENAELKELIEAGTGGE